MNLLVTWLIAGTLVAAVATAAARLIPQTSPGQRHAFWWLTLVVMLGLPWFPTLQMPLMSDVARLATTSAAPASPVFVPAPPSWLARLAGGVWALVASFAFVRLAVNLRVVRRLSRSARPLAAARAGRLGRFTEARAGSRAAQVFVSDEVRGACAVGFLRPRILLSSDLVATLDADGIEAIVLHEYAHLQRYDDWSRLAQKMILAVAGLHPAVHWVSRHIDVEREAACDRVVVARTGEPVAYARSLAQAADIAGRMSGITPQVAPGASIGGGLHARIERLVSAGPVRPVLAWLASGAGTIGLALTAAIAASMPPLVVVATLEAPIDALAGSPIRAALVRELPTEARTALSNLAVGGAGAVRAARSPQTGAPTSPVPSATPQRELPAGAASDPFTAQAVDQAPAATAADQPAVLSSAPLMPAFAPPPLAGSSPDARQPQEGGIGASATRLGVATGDAATRAGTSIGRFFRNRAQAIAGNF